MDLFKEEYFSSAHLGHLGLVADKIDSLNIIDLIDSRLPVSEAHGAKVSHGERVAAMIMNGLGFIDCRLYLFPDFLKDKPVERLFGRRIQAQWFNDDAIGRCLDAISDYGTTKLLTELSLTIGLARNLLGKSAHIDTTTLSLFGDFEKYSGNQSQDTPLPKHGYAKSGRHDLKQMVLLLATTGAANFPLWMESHSGNASDQKTLPNAAVKIKQLCSELKNAPDFTYVGDSAIYANILQHSADMFWITRAPEKIKEIRSLVSIPEDKISWTDIGNGYSYSAVISQYKDVKQRWIMFFSEAAYCRESKTLDKKVQKEAEVQAKDWWHLSNQIFTCHDDAYVQAQKQQKLLKFHNVNFSIKELKKHTSKGRPTQGELPKTIGYKIEYTLRINEQKITEARNRKGRFVLATNQLDESILSNEEVLQEYKAQSGTERGFKFIKDNTFQVDSVFLKTPERIDALMMVMTLCLMVYGVSEYELQQSLQNNKETIPSQTKKRTSTPSLRWVYFLFRVVDELTINTGSYVQKIVVNLDAVLRKIIRHFGRKASAIYLNPA